jgi:Leucine-rich repeat (LRR) protein
MGLHRLTGLTFLNLSFTCCTNRIGDDGAAMSEALASMSGLEELNLDGTLMSDAVLRALLPSLASLKHLKELYLPLIDATEASIPILTQFVRTELPPPHRGVVRL